MGCRWWLGGRGGGGLGFPCLRSEAAVNSSPASGRGRKAIVPQVKRAPCSFFMPVGATFELQSLYERGEGGEGRIMINHVIDIDQPPRIPTMQRRSDFCRGCRLPRLRLRMTVPAIIDSHHRCVATPKTICHRFVLDMYIPGSQFCTLSRERFRLHAHHSNNAALQWLIHNDKCAVH